MKLFQMNNWQLTTSEELWGLLPFKKILERDRSKDKELANKEILFVYFFCDIRSDYIIHSDDIKTEEIKKDIGLPKTWEVDKVIEDAIDLYKKRSETVIQKLYKQSLKAASDIGEYLENTKQLLDEK
jgi:hypothetical protein